MDLSRGSRFARYENSGSDEIIQANRQPEFVAGNTTIADNSAASSCRNGALHEKFETINASDINWPIGELCTCLKGLVPKCMFSSVCKHAITTGRCEVFAPNLTSGSGKNKMAALVNSVVFNSVKSRSVFPELLPFDLPRKRVRLASFQFGASRTVALTSLPLFELCVVASALALAGF